MGLVLKPGSQEPWTPYRMFSAFVEAGIPARGVRAVSRRTRRGRRRPFRLPASHDFRRRGDRQQYHGNPRVQVHGPGFSKILLGDDVVDEWEQYLDLMVESIYANGGRSCINSSGVWASRHTRSHRPSSGRTARTGRSQTARRPRGRPGGVHSPGNGTLCLADDRGGSARAGRQGYDVPVRAAIWSSASVVRTCARSSRTAIRRIARSRKRNTCSPSPP